MADLAIRFALVALIVYWSFLLLSPFIVILIWAAILSVALYPGYLWLKRVLGGRSSLASFLLTVFTLVVILGPIGIFAAALVQNLSGIAAGISEGTVTVPPPPPYIAEWPLVGSRLSAFWQAAYVELVETLASIEPQLRAVSRRLFGVAGTIGVGILQFAVAIIIAGFTYSRAEGLQKSLKNFAARAAPHLGEGFLDLAQGTVRNVVKGVIGVALFQSLLFGIGAMVAGIPLVGLWTFLVLILATVQVSVALLIVPVIIFAWSSMDTLSAAILTVYMVPVSLVDNVLRPIVMARGLPVPMLVIFIGVIGGVLAHGLVGLFVGPIVLAFGYELGRKWIAMRSSSSET